MDVVVGLCGLHLMRTPHTERSREGDLHTVDCDAYAGFIWEERIER